jgi:hypothetical protein
MVAELPTVSPTVSIEYEVSMDLEASAAEKLFRALEDAGLPKVPQEFSVVLRHQVIPSATLEEIARFIDIFDRVTAREAWQVAARRDAPASAQRRCPEVCFFSGWDFHLSPAGGFQLIEFNDNGSGFIFAAIINALYYQAAKLREENSVSAPMGTSAFGQHLGNLVEQEARSFFKDVPNELFLIIDDADSLRSGRFRREHRLLCDLFRGRGWRAEFGSPAETSWNGRQLLFDGEPVAFVVNRSTDFFWQSDDFSALCKAHDSGRVYVAPNPSTYATRSDKRLLEWLSLPHWDAELGIQPEERRVLSAHTPETHLLRDENLNMLAERKHDFVFKPLHGFAGRGLLDSGMIGHARLRHLVRIGEGYVAQRRVAKPAMETQGATVWTDLRVWAYRGQIFEVSGRASRRPDRLELIPPGGWLPTYSSL